MIGAEEEEPPGSATVSKIHLPFTFEVHPSLNNSHPLVITILQKLNNVILDKVSLPVFKLDDPKNVRVAKDPVLTKNQRIFKLQNDIHQLLKSLRTCYFFVKIQKRVSDKDQHLGLVFNIVGQFYGILDLPDGTSFRNIVCGEYSMGRSIRHPQQLITNIKISSAKNLILNDEMAKIMADFSMTPPGIENSKLPPNIVGKVLFSPHTEENPLQFLYSRYFTILYSLNTPLSYFPKTALTRLANLCDNDPLTISNTLKKVVWKIDEMDERHQNKYGIIKKFRTQNLSLLESLSELNKTISPTEVTLKTKYEIRSQEDFIAKHETILQDFIRSSKKRDEATDDVNVALTVKEISSEQLVQKVFMELKIREAQLQVLIVLELLKIWKIDESKFLEECLQKRKKDAARKNKEAKQSLVRKKKPKVSRKIIPTFLGMGMNVRNYDHINLNQEDSIDKFTLFASLDTIVDRMGLWDTILGRTQVKDNDSAYGFLAYVLVPYFNKRLPVVLQYVIDKIKGLNMKLVTKSFKTFESEVMKRTLKLEGAEIPNDPDKPEVISNETPLQDPSDTSRPSKLRKTLVNLKVPSLKKSATFDLSTADILRPAFSLKRSKSNLSSKNLQKRQVDISISTDKSKEKASRKPGSSELPDEGSFIFGKARKVKSSLQSKGLQIQRADSVSQVQATPSKNRIKDIDGLIKKPRRTDANKIEEGRKEVTTNIEVTPARRATQLDRSTSLPQIQKTPLTTKSWDFNAILNTPEDRFTKPLVVNSNPPSGMYSNALLNVSSAPSLEVISPLKYSKDNNAITSSPVAKPQRTPQESIVSSPFIQNPSNSKRKPGQPISANESPFFDSNLNGSPIFGTKSSGIFGKSKSTGKR